MSDKKKLIIHTVCKILRDPELCRKEKKDEENYIFSYLLLVRYIFQSGWDGSLHTTEEGLDKLKELERELNIDIILNN